MNPYDYTISGRRILESKANIERRIGKFKERHSKVAKYYEIKYQHREFSYTVPDDMMIAKRFSNSLKKLKNKVEKNNQLSCTYEKTN